MYHSAQGSSGPGYRGVCRRAQRSLRPDTWRSARPCWTRQKTAAGPCPTCRCRRVYEPCARVDVEVTGGVGTTIPDLTQALLADLISRLHIQYCLVVVAAGANQHYIQAFTGAEGLSSNTETAPLVI